MTVLQIATPRAFLPLLAPRRYKGARGGRGGAKSHFFAEKLIEDMLCEHVRAACVREIQNSIKDSVKQLIEDKIDRLGVADRFYINDTEIRGPNDGLVIFRGLQNHTASSLKSLEGFNRCLVEEAQTITQRSLDILTPTFRSPGAELWFAWNPFSAKDPVEQLFEVNKDDPDFALVTVNYYDNPWFPKELRLDMERDKRRDPDKYAHIWLGGYRRSSEASVFRNWRIEEFEAPQDARFYYGADWGFSVDPTVLTRCYLHGRTLYVDYEAYKVGCEIDRTPELFDTVPGSRKWPITADSARPETISYMNRHGFRMTPAVKGQGSVEDGIEFLKSYDIVVHPRCAHTIDELSSYSWVVDKKTEEVLPVLADKDNHVIDALRYAVEGLRRKGPVIVSPEMLEIARRRGMNPRYA
jgi:phage terminase large subunit